MQHMSVPVQRLGICNTEGFDVCVLCYGDHPELADRCLSSIVSRCRMPEVKTVRVGLNAVAPITRKLVCDLLRKLPMSLGVMVFDAGEANRLKYPMMRKMFASGMLGEFTMWFDDDSAIQSKASTTWFDTALAVAKNRDLVGKIYMQRPVGHQAENIKKQPWYTGKELKKGDWFKFVTGGFWIARTSILKKWDYPFSAIRHNGGDVMLGELCRQQGLKVFNFDHDVLINTAKRRGESMPPVWSAVLEPPEDHHDFELDVYDLRARQ